MTIRIAKTEEDFLKCRSAVQALRPKLTNDLYLQAVEQTIASGRQMVFVDTGTHAAAVSVFETGYNLFRGKYIYIDDLSTLPEDRGKGYAGKLLDWIFDYAKRENVDEVHLDSGVSEARADAHRLYLNKRFQVTSLHFVARV